MLGRVAYESCEISKINTINHRVFLPLSRRRMRTLSAQHTLTNNHLSANPFLFPSLPCPALPYPTLKPPLPSLPFTPHPLHTSSSAACNLTLLQSLPPTIHPAPAFSVREKEIVCFGSLAQCSRECLHRRTVGIVDVLSISSVPSDADQSTCHW